jgi:hypothetical protein
MRAVFSLGLVLLALTLALNHARALFSRAPAEPRLADRALEIVAGAKGPLLPAARIGTGPERVGEAIRLGDRTLVGTGRPGLRAAFLAPDFALSAERCYDVAGSREEARALRAAVEEVEPGTLLVLASSGRLEPEGNEPRPELEDALARLGARARPGTSTPESWALIALRLDGGWVPLAEGYSRDSGVALAFVVGADLDSYAGFRGDFALVRAGAREEVSLEDELEHASSRSAGVALAPAGIVQGQRMAGIRVPPAEAEGATRAGRIGWSGVEIGPGSWLVAWLGLEDVASAGSDGVACEVRVDGEVLERRLVQPGARWKVLEVDLRAFAGRRVELELAVDPRESAAGDAALWGWPRLLHGYPRSPLEMRAEER